MRVRCPHCHNPIELVEDSSFSEIVCSVCGSSFSLIGGEDETETYRGGEKTIGHFTLTERLGVGAFGTVWKAKDTQLDRTVAIKIPRKGQLSSSETEQFLREARATAQLKHPNIVSVHEVGKDDDSVYIVSDYVQGATLKDMLGGQPLPPREAAELAATIADALHHAHEQGVIHRDLKPGNVMIDLVGKPHVLDFGLAKRESGEITVTVDGALVGTPAYMSPEQARGDGHSADRQSDIYSLGVILFEMLTGELPFRGQKRMLILQILTEEPPRLKKLNANVPRDLEVICLKCMSKERKDRYASAQELGDELRRYIAGLPIHARPTTLARRVTKWISRNPRIVATAAFALLLAVTAVLQTSKERRRSERQQIATAVASLDTNRGILQPPYALLNQFSRNLLVTELEQQFQDSKDRKLPLAFALANYGDVRLDFLLSQVQSAAPNECENFVSALQHERNESLEKLHAAAKALQGADSSTLRHKARLAMLSLQLGDPSIATAMCQPRSNMIARTVFIKECSNWIGNLAELCSSCANIKNEAMLSSVCLVVGSIPAESMSEAELALWSAQLTSWYGTHIDQSIHSASGWAIRRLGLDLEPRSVNSQELASAMSAFHELERAAKVWADMRFSIQRQLHKSIEDRKMRRYTFDKYESLEIREETQETARSFVPGQSDCVERFGISGSSVRLNGDFALADSIPPAENESFAIGCWFRSSKRGRSVLLSRVSRDGKRGYRLTVADGYIEAQVFGDDGLIDLKPVHLPHPVEWHHAILTYDGSIATKGVTLYVDGVEQARTTVIDDQVDVHAIDGPLIIGGDSNNRFFSGLIDELILYDGHLSNEEVNHHYWSGLEKIVRIPDIERTPDQEHVLLLAYMNQSGISRWRYASTSDPVLRVREAYWGGRKWRVNAAGITMLQVPAGAMSLSFRSPSAPRGFSVSDREISVRAFRQFLDDDEYPKENKPRVNAERTYYEERKRLVDAVVHPDEPQRRITWCDAVMFCNWLSHREGLRPCYERTGQRYKDRSGNISIHDEWRLSPDGNGYRLPTALEWEYICRAGSITRFSFGEDLSHIDDYAVCRAESTEVCGSRKPNAWGVFDMHGNVSEWCHGPSNTLSLAGGKWDDLKIHCESDRFAKAEPTWPSGGFRVVSVTP